MHAWMLCAASIADRWQGLSHRGGGLMDYAAGICCWRCALLLQGCSRLMGTDAGLCTAAVLHACSERTVGC